MNKKFLDTIEYSISDKNILLRTDYNVPIKDDVIINDDRIKESLPTIDLLWEKGVKNIIIVTHLGRPSGKRTLGLSLEPIKKYLQKIYTDHDVYLTDLYQSQTVLSNKRNSIILIENIRFYPEEERKSSQINIELFEQKLAKLADIFVNDAFGTCHRNHCSMMGKGYEYKIGGLLVKKELTNILPKINSPKRPFVCIMGGAKVSDKIKLIYNLLDKVDHIIIGGGMAFTFLKESIGPSKVAIPYPVIATTKNFNTGFSLTLSQAPRRVSKPLIIPPHDGKINITEKTVPKFCAHSGSAV